MRKLSANSLRRGTRVSLNAYGLDSVRCVRVSMCSPSRGKVKRFDFCLVDN